MEKFGLELESSKSRLIEFGRFAEQNRRARGECKPETFDFLGFTFYCSKTRKGGFVPKVQTSRKKFEQKVRAYKNWIYDNRNRPMREIIKELNVKLMLKDGEMLSSDCEEKLEAAGFKKSTIKKAKKNTGVISRKKGFLWYWSLPMGDIPRE